MTSKITSSTSLPTSTTSSTTRRRRASSDDFGTGSLGSIGGSEVGSSVASPSGVHSPGARKQQQPHQALSPPPVAAISVIATPVKPPASSAAGAAAAGAAAAASAISAVDATPTTKNTKSIHGGDSSSSMSDSIMKPAALGTKTAAPAPPSTSIIPPPIPSHPSAMTGGETTTTTTTPNGSPPLSRRPFRKRKGSVDFTLSLDDIPDTPTDGNDSRGSRSGSLLLRSTMDALPSVDALPPLMDGATTTMTSASASGSHNNSTTTSTGSPMLLRPKNRSRSDSLISAMSIGGGVAGLGGGEGRRPRSASGISLERLDALGEEARLAAARIRGDSITTFRSRKGSTSDNSNVSRSSSHGTFTSQSHRMLLEAFMGGDDDDHGHGHDHGHDHHDDQDDDDEFDDEDEDEDEHDLDNVDDDDNESLVDSQAAEEAETNELKREERLGSFDVRDRLGSFDVRDRLGSFDVRDRLGSFDVRDRLGSFDVRDRLGSFDATHDRIESFGGRRERLESWGGMSDLSIPVPDSTGIDSLLGEGSGTNATVALAADIYSSLANDLTAAANTDGNESISSFLVNDEKIPTKIDMTRGLLNSVNSNATDPSISQLPTEDEIPSDIQKFVKAAMASVGDQLAEIAVAATEAARDHEDQSELSSTASPIIGAASDTGSKSGSWMQRPRSSSLTAGMDIAVDYDAVAAAVNAAEAAAGAIDLATFANTTNASVTSEVSSKPGHKRKRPQLPTKNSKKSCLTAPGAGAAAGKPGSKETPKKPMHIELPPIPKSKMDERDMEIIRERARAAAGYVPPSIQNGDKPPVPPKKKTKLDNPNTPNIKPSAGFATPRTSNSAITQRSVLSTPYTPAFSTPGSAKTTASKGQSSQKWDSMFECLIEFIQDRKKEETHGFSDQDKKEWIWDGNVPTTYKSNDGKALGRWVNNQRSAKSKGVLKGDREKRLVDAGLKWSVLASNSWNEMLEELRVYVNDQTKAGRKWDGNVPTNYRIKTKPGVAAREDDDKNLGRWVNRQRSLYQAGKLRKDRQLALEKVGLKWSMLATTSWDSMYETLCEYVEAKTRDGSEWDGNVPANYRTSDNPPRALGRWINRQRSSYGKDKIKTEYVDKLNKLGLKWSVHERRLSASSPDGVPSAAMNGNGTSNNSPPSPIPSEHISYGCQMNGGSSKQGDDSGDDDEDEEFEEEKPSKAVAQSAAAVSAAANSGTQDNTNVNTGSDDKNHESGKEVEKTSTDPKNSTDATESGTQEKAKTYQGSDEKTPEPAKSAENPDTDRKGNSEVNKSGTQEQANTTQESNEKTHEPGKPDGDLKPKDGSNEKTAAKALENSDTEPKSDTNAIDGGRTKETKVDAGPDKPASETVEASENPVTGPTSNGDNGGGKQKETCGTKDGFDKKVTESSENPETDLKSKTNSIDSGTQEGKETKVEGGTDKPATGTGENSETDPKSDKSAIDSGVQRETAKPSSESVKAA